jgi:predicted DNA-binding transcriptional regulator AlpA
VIIHQNENSKLETNSYQTAANQKTFASDSRPTLRRGLRRVEASDYIGISASKFDALVKDGRMPPPKRIDGCVVWDKRQLDSAFDKLPGGDDHDQNSWDEAFP